MKNTTMKKKKKISLDKTVRSGFGQQEQFFFLIFLFESCLFA
jgi:hypothetical protein